MKLWAWQTERKEEHVISPQCKFCPAAVHLPLFPSASPPLLHLSSEDSIGSSFKRISIRVAVFCVSVQASSHINAFPSFCLSLRCFLVQVHSGATLHLSVSRDRWRVFLGYQERRVYRAEMPTVWERKVCLPTDTRCHFRMERTG